MKPRRRSCSALFARVLCTVAAIKTARMCWPNRVSGGGGGVGTRPGWLALLACGGAYWPFALEPSAMTSRHPHCCGLCSGGGRGQDRTRRCCSANQGWRGQQGSVSANCLAKDPLSPRRWCSVQIGGQLRRILFSEGGLKRSVSLENAVGRKQ